MIFCQVTPDEIPAVLPLEKYSPRDSHGGEVVFRGLVRNTNHGRKVTALSYDSFVPLAEQTLREICAEAQSKWGDDLEMAVVHRTGRLEIGDCAVVAVASSKHRQEAFDACQYVIEELKVRAPIWKKEHYIDGDSEWLQGHALCGHRREPAHASSSDAQARHSHSGHEGHRHG